MAYDRREKVLLSCEIPTIFPGKKMHAIIYKGICYFLQETNIYLAAFICLYIFKTIYFKSGIKRLRWICSKLKVEWIVVIYKRYSLICTLL